jgi:hypothetical protein
MSETTIYVAATRQEVRQAIQQIPSGAMGENGAKAAADAMMLRTGFAALKHIKDAFIAKSRGGTDEAGDRWKPLKRETVAYGRRHRKKAGDPSESRVFSRAKNLPWIPRSSGRAAYAPSYALTDKQKERWWDVYRQQLARFRGNKAAAAKFAWAVLKGEGATTLIAQYGDAQVDILRDTGILLNSLSPGVDSGTQIMRVGHGEVIVGTNVPYAVYHHEGRGHNPQRRLWPSPAKWPSRWWTNIAEVARDGLVVIAIFFIKRASG